jgi:ATP-dependent exoDNAse (exonuclease V) beta subunit
VEVFQRLKREFAGGNAEGAGSGGTTPVGAADRGGDAEGTGELRINYRSHGRLVDFFNTLFAGVMTAPPGSADYEARYAPIEGLREEPEVNPRITLMYKPYRKDLDPEYVDGGRAEAWHVSRTIRRIVADEELPVHDGAGGSRPCRYGDIAVLMRSTGNQIHYERYLRRLGVPYTVQGTRSLFLEAPAYDIYNLLQLLVYPEDRLAYASLLRSPLAGLSDLTMSRILLDRAAGETARARPEEYPPAFSHSGEEELFPDDDERRAYLAAKEMYLELCRRAPAASIRDLLRAVWYEYGYRYTVLENPDLHPYLELYGTLCEYARLYEERGEGLVAFLDFLRENLGQFEKVEETGGTPGRSEGVQILSIHRSKGLEFPVVFLVDTGNTGRQGGSDQLYTLTREFGPVVTWGRDGTLTPNRFMRRAKEEEEERDRAELKRLFYVACTRAEDHLFISGCHHGKNRNAADGTGRNAMLNMLLGGLGWRGGPEDLEAAAIVESLGGVMEVEEIPEVTEGQLLGGSRFVRRLDPEAAAAEYAKSGAVERSFRRRDYSAVELSAAASAEPAGEPGPTGEEEPEPAGKHGPAGEEEPEPAGEPGPAGELPAFACDRFLQKEEEIRAFGILVHSRIEEALSTADRPALLPAALAEKPEEERRAIEEEAERIAGEFLRSGLGSRARAGRCECELPFLLRVLRNNSEEMYVRGQIDLLLEETEEVTVCDFKTDRRKEPELHAGQLAAYRRAAAELYGKPVRTLLCYLRSMELVELDAGEISELGAPGAPE